MDTTLKQRFRYTIYLDSTNVGLVEFEGEVYYYDHSEGIWRFGDEGGRELVVNSMELIYFTAEPLTVQQVGDAS